MKSYMLCAILVFTTFLSFNAHAITITDPVISNNTVSYTIESPVQEGAFQITNINEFGHIMWVDTPPIYLWSYSLNSSIYFTGQLARDTAYTFTLIYDQDVTSLPLKDYGLLAIPNFASAIIKGIDFSGVNQNVAEPPTLAMFCLGLLGLGFANNRIIRGRPRFLLDSRRSL